MDAILNALMAPDATHLILVGGGAGTLGQFVRLVLGIWKTYGFGLLSGSSQESHSARRRVLVGMGSGFIAGAAAALVAHSTDPAATAMKETTDMVAQAAKELDLRSLAACFLSGYAGADAAEGFVNGGARAMGFGPVRSGASQDYLG